jgi:hypothetical protein
MADDFDTAVFQKVPLKPSEPLPPDTSIGGISVRGWLVVILTSTVCAISTYNQIMKPSTTIIEEPLYSGFMIALGYYFGQKK